jgi:DNA-binding response OmpR family regulator
LPAASRACSQRGQHDQPYGYTLLHGRLTLSRLRAGLEEQDVRRETVIRIEREQWHLISFTPEAAILDIGLLVIDGYELTGHIRRTAGSRIRR